MTEKLKPCPFCGGEPFMVDAEIDGRAHYIVKCTACHSTSGVMQMDRSKAAKAWNRRAERTCRMDKSEFADFAPEYEELHSCHKCGEQTAVLACVNEGGDMEWVKPRFCGYCGAKVVMTGD